MVFGKSEQFRASEPKWTKPAVEKKQKIAPSVQPIL